MENYILLWFIKKEWHYKIKKKEQIDLKSI